MGVLNIQEHLRHRRPRESEENDSNNHTWEEEFFELAQHQVPQEEPARRSHSRGRAQKNKTQHYSTNNGRKSKTGCRQMKRHENTCFLLSLVDQEELGELDVSDFVNNNVSAFAELFTSVEKLKIWTEFISLPEEEQETILWSGRKTGTAEKQNNRGHSNDRLKPFERDAVAIAEKSFNRIEGRIRGTLTMKRFPLDGLKQCEDEVISFFTDDPSALMITVPPSRLLMHGVCQFLNLTSTSVDRNGVRIMEIENQHRGFSLPSLLLSQYLKQYR